MPSDDIITTNLQFNLGNIYQATGQYGEALPLLQQALEILEKALGPDHPHVATSLNNLAGLYYTTGEYHKALELLERALAIWQKVFQPGHPTLVSGLENLAILKRQLANLVDRE